MAKMVYARQFVEHASEIHSDKVYKNLLDTLRAVEKFPLVGSADIPRSIRTNFGGQARKAVVSPFDVIYEYDEANDTVFVYDLIPCKRAK